MMEYSIGSVADLISGSDTPNKPRVVKKQFKAKGKIPGSVKIARKISTPDENQKVLKTKHSTSPKVKKPKSVKNIKLSNNDEPEEEINIAIKKPGKKRTKKQSITPKAKRSRPITELPSDSDDDAESENEFDINKDTIYSSEGGEWHESDVKGGVNDSDNEEESDVTNETDGSSDEEELDDGFVQKEADESNDSEESGNESNMNVQINKEKAMKPENAEQTTIFVGNLPISIGHNKLKKLFSKFGNVENARIRSIPVADPAVPKKVAAIKKQFHPDRKSLHGYVTFTKREDAMKALSFNGKEYKDHHIRVNMCDESEKPDRSKAIFLGNVSFGAEEEELWKLFQSCGEIESVRLVRDRRTDIGKGFGYINFKSSDSVELALQMGEVKLRDRVLRISLYNGKAPKKANKQTPKAFGKQKKEPNSERTGTNGQFQGKTASEKKKKYHKGNQQKKKLAKKIAPNISRT